MVCREQTDGRKVGDGSASPRATSASGFGPKSEDDVTVRRAASAAPRRDEATGTWWFVVDLGASQDGKRRQAKRRGFRTKKLAQEELDKLRREVTTSTYVAPARQTLGEYLDKWLAGLPNSGLRASTLDSYSRTLSYLRPALGGRRLDRVTAADLDLVYAELLSSGMRHREGGLSPRTVRYAHSILRKAFADAVRKGELIRNPATAASPPSAKATKAPEQSWWTPEQLRTFLTATRADPLFPLFRLAAMSGMRRGEVLGVRWSDIDLDSGRVEVRQQIIVINGKVLVADRLKSDHGRRSIDLDPSTTTALRTHRARQAELRLLVGTGYRDNDLVFAQPDGEPLDPGSVTRIFERRALKCGLPRIRFHDLRHGHAAHLIAAGRSTLEVSRRLGHASAAFTLSHYGHVFESAGAEAAAAVAAMVDGGS
jgi:integrase